MFDIGNLSFAVFSKHLEMLDVLYYLKDKKETFSLKLDNGTLIGGFTCVGLGAYPECHDAYGTYWVKLSNGMTLSLDTVAMLSVYRPVLKDYIPSTGVEGNHNPV